MKKYAMVKVRSGDWYNKIQEKKLQIRNYCCTVKKTPEGLYWKTGAIYINPKYIDEVIEGDIVEYLL